MKNSIALACLFAGWATSVQAQVAPTFARTNPAFLRSFHAAVEPAAASTVRIRCDGADTCLGIIVAADGWILTKAHDLTGTIKVALRDDREFVAKKLGVHQGHDLALLKIDAKQLKAAEFADSKNLQAGAWVASVGLGRDPLAVGVVSVPTRKVIEAYLGVRIDKAAEGVAVLGVYVNTPAAHAGIRAKDIILSINGQRFVEPEQFQQHLAGYRPGEAITLRVRRGADEHAVKVTLQRRDLADARSDFQNRLGSELSSRRSGYAIILQHDTVLKPSDCGGPLVDLRGRIVGINISRAGRVETWAIPAEVVRPLIAELKKGR